MAEIISRRYIFLQHLFSTRILFLQSSEGPVVCVITNRNTVFFIEISQVSDRKSNTKKLWTMIIIRAGPRTVTADKRNSNFLVKKCNLLIPRLPLRTSKLQDKFHPSTENMQHLEFSSLLWVIFTLLDTDPDRFNRKKWKRIRMNNTTFFTIRSRAQWYKIYRTDEDFTWGGGRLDAHAAVEFENVTDLLDD